MTQRNGRIIRQGNRNKEVQVYQYVTEGTFAQGTQPNETLLILALERRLLSILELKSHVSQSLNKAIKALWFLLQHRINRIT